MGNQSVWDMQKKTCNRDPKARNTIEKPSVALRGQDCASQCEGVPATTQSREQLSPLGWQRKSDDDLTCLLDLRVTLELRRNILEGFPVRSHCSKKELAVV